MRAIQLYYRKFGHYPGSIEQLEKTNNIRFLRQKYVDPMTGKDDWRLIHVGEAKTTVKGFFGQPLAGLTPGLGSAAGMASAGPAGAGAAGQRQCVRVVFGDVRLGVLRRVRVGWGRLGRVGLRGCLRWVAGVLRVGLTGGATSGAGGDGEWADYAGGVG